MTVVEKIIALKDEQLMLWFEGKSYRPETKARLAEISEKLREIRETCPHSWAKAERILSGEAPTC
jgi:hypothetical protein